MGRLLGTRSRCFGVNGLGDGAIEYLSPLLCHYVTKIWALVASSGLDSTETPRSAAGQSELLHLRPTYASFRAKVPAQAPDSPLSQSDNWLRRTTTEVGSSQHAASSLPAVNSNAAAPQSQPISDDGTSQRLEWPSRYAS